MTSTTPPYPPSGNGEPSAASHKQPPVPFYKRSFFWAIIGMLVGLVLLLLARGCWFREVPPVAKEDPNAEMTALLDLQRAHNNGLEEEIRRLQGMLKEDPCALRGILGQRPEEAPVAPSYGATAPDSRQDTTAPPSSANGTAVPPTANGTTQPPRSTNGTAPLVSAAPPPSTVSELMDMATVFILSQYNGQVGMGSGFFVAPGVIATNSHVAQGPDAKILVGNKVLGGMQPASIIAYSHDENRDYALLRINMGSAGKAPILQLANGANRTERVSAWGFPGYITEIDPKLKALAQGDSSAVPEVVYSEGVVSVVLERTPPAILHTASISQGNSGGPLINAQGVVVGINTFIKKADKSYSQTNIALPGGDLARFMQENGVSASMAKQ